MAMFSTGVKPHARKVLIYGVQGVGKTRLAASFPASVVIDIERGSLDFHCTRNDKTIGTYQDFKDLMLWLIANDHGFSTVVIDSLTKLQSLVFNQVCEDKKAASIGEIGGGFGRGDKLALAEFVLIETLINALIGRGIAVVCTAHCSVVKTNEPNSPIFATYAPDLLHSDSGNIRDMIKHSFDEVFLMKQETFTTTEKAAFGAERASQVKTQNRFLVTSDTGGVCAKHRLGVIPSVIPADVNTYIQYVLAVKPTMVESPNDIGGIVVDGSSKKQEPKTEALTEALTELEATKVF